MEREIGRGDERAEEEHGSRVKWMEGAVAIKCKSWQGYKRYSWEMEGAV